MQHSRVNRIKVAVALSLMAALALMLAACGSSSGGDDEGVSGDQIKFGLISAFSGSAASYGPPEKAAVEAAIGKINSEGGVKVGDKSYDLSLTTYDSAYDPTKAVTVTRQAVTQDGIKFIEVLGGGIVPAVQPITEPAKVLVFAVAAGDEFVGTDHPMTFRPYYDVPKSVEADLKFLQGRLGDGAKVVHLYPDEDLGHSVAPKSQERAEALGYSSEVEYIPRESTDFAPVLSRIDKGTDVIDFGPTPPTQYAVIVRQARQLGYKGTFVFPDTVDMTTLLESASAKDVAGSVTSPAWENLKTAPGRHFAAEAKKRVGEVQGWTAQAYDNLFLLKAAIEKAGTVDTEKVADTLSQVSIEGALGDVRYGGEKEYGIPRVFEIPYPVAEVTPQGTLKTVTEVNISE